MRYDDPILSKLAADAEQRYGLPANILNAIRLGGERSNSWQVSPKQAKGVYQFIPDTWRAYGGGADPTDPYAATEAAAKMVADLVRQYKGNIPAVLAHYNGGTASGRAVLEGRPLNSETAAYVPRALAQMQTPAKASAPAAASRSEVDDLFGIPASRPSSLDLETGPIAAMPALSPRGDMYSESPLVAQAAEPEYTMQTMQGDLDSLFGLPEDALAQGIAGASVADLPAYTSLSELIGGMSEDDIRTLFDEEMNGD